MAIKQCIVCGSDFLGKTNSNACSKECRGIRRQTRQNDWHRNKRKNDPEYLAKGRAYSLNYFREDMADPERRKARLVRQREWMRRRRCDPKVREKLRQQNKSRAAKTADLLAVLRVEMPEILKEFGL